MAGTVNQLVDCDTMSLESFVKLKVDLKKLKQGPLNSKCSASGCCSRIAASSTTTVHAQATLHGFCVSGGKSLSEIQCLQLLPAFNAHGWQLLTAQVPQLQQQQQPQMLPTLSQIAAALSIRIDFGIGRCLHTPLLKVIKAALHALRAAVHVIVTKPVSPSCSSAMHLDRRISSCRAIAQGGARAGVKLLSCPDCKKARLCVTPVCKAQNVCNVVCHVG